MPLLPCRECGSSVSTTAAACPQCGTKDPTSVQHYAAERRRESRGNQLQRAAWGGIALVAAAAFAYFLVPESIESQARRRCLDLVTAQLRAPGTAAFVEDAISVTQQGESGFLVDGQVDAENGFGAKIRSRFFCFLTRQPDGQWSPTDAAQIASE
jgi:hypothetical protein